LFSMWPQDISRKVFVIDNGSADRTMDIVKTYGDRVTLIHSDRGNIGFGAAHNLVMDQLDSDVHLIMNPDITLPDHESISLLYHFLMDHSDIGMAVPRILDEKGQQQFLCRRQMTILDLALRFLPGHLFQKRMDHHIMKDMDYSTSFEVEFASGCFMAIRTELFKELGGFDESFFLYAEDADLTRRVNQKAKTVYLPEAVVIHAWKRASYKNPAMTRIHLKSLWRYFRKWGVRIL